MTRFDDTYLSQYTGTYLNFGNATFMTDIYFTNEFTMVVKGIKGEKHIINLDTLDIVYVAGDVFPEVYIKPYWYSQPTNDTLFVHDKHGSKYLFDLGHPIQFMGKSQENLIFISPNLKDSQVDKHCQGPTVCNTFW